MKFDLKLAAGMTPTGIKLYQFAVNRTLPATVSAKDFERLCGFEGSVPGWQCEMERVCREIVSANVVKNAYVADDVIYLL